MWFQFARPTWVHSNRAMTIQIHAPNLPFFHAHGLSVIQSAFLTQFNIRSVEMHKDFPREQQHK
jgi:hypothetical protein